VSQDVRVKMLGIVVAAVAVVALAACGSSTSTAAPAAGGSSSTTAAPSTTAPSTTQGGSAAVKTASNAKLGSLLVDASGMTLYTLTNAGQPVACTGGCLTAWPPLLLASGTTTPTGASGVTGLGTTSVAGGTQVTENGAPLYHFSGDTAAGDANGDGLSSFGGTWHVVAASASTGVTSPPTAAPAGVTTTTSGYGY
jgi:predicted lipoprotein with Yx(FWY)xxD motif